MQKSNSDRSRKTIIAIVALLLLLLVGGIGSGQFFPGSGSETAEAAEIPYPRIWTEQGLPVIPEGEIVDQDLRRRGNQGSFVILTPMPAEEVAEYLEDEFDDRDWDYYDVCLDDENTYGNEFYGEESEVIIEAAPDSQQPGMTRVQVAIRRCLAESTTAPSGFTSTGRAVTMRPDSGH